MIHDPSPNPTFPGRRDEAQRTTAMSTRSNNPLRRRHQRCLGPHRCASTLLHGGSRPCPLTPPPTCAHRRKDALAPLLERNPSRRPHPARSRPRTKTPTRRRRQTHSGNGIDDNSDSNHQRTATYLARSTECRSGSERGARERVSFMRTAQSFRSASSSLASSGMVSSDGMPQCSQSVGAGRNPLEGCNRGDRRSIAGVHQRTVP